MHLQEIFHLTFIQDQGHMKHCPLHHMTYVPSKFEVAKTNGQGEELPENILFDLDPKVNWVKVTQKVAQYPRHRVTCAPAKFDVATSHG